MENDGTGQCPLPEVSVILCVYNGQSYLRDAVNSILDQTYTDFELIVVDDGSNDESAEILRSYRDERVRLLQSGKNIGLTKSLNIGLSHARGRYIARQDVDDISLSNRLQKQVEYLHQHPEIAVVGTWIEQIDTNGTKLGRVAYPLGSAEIRERLLHENCLCHGSVLMRREQVTDLGGYREMFMLAQDWDLWLRMSEKYALANLPDVLYLFRRRPSSLSAAQQERQRRYGRMAAEQAVERRTSGSKVNCLSPKALAQHYLFLAGEDVAERQDAAARTHLERALRMFPELLLHPPTILEPVIYRGISLVSSNNGNSCATGEDYINRWFAVVPPHATTLIRRRSSVVGMYYAVLAFQYFRNEHWTSTLRCAAKGIRYAPLSLFNIGFLSMVGQSIARRLQCPKSV